MTKRLAMICAAAIFSIGLTSPSVQANDSEISRRSLQGISAVSVDVEDLSDGAKALGLSEEAIRTDVELKLRLAGIRVVAVEEDVKVPGMPTLYVNPQVLSNAKALSITVELQQNVLLERNGQRAVNVTTWEVGGVGMNPTAQSIRDNIKDFVDQFLNAWLSVNPKK
jgi:hypothetical protein